MSERALGNSMKMSKIPISRRRMVNGFWLFSYWIQCVSVGFRFTMHFFLFLAIPGDTYK